MEVEGSTENSEFQNVSGSSVPLEAGLPSRIAAALDYGKRLVKELFFCLFINRLKIDLVPPKRA